MNKKIIIVTGIFVLFVVLLSGYYFFFFKESLVGQERANNFPMEVPIPPFVHESEDSKQQVEIDKPVQVPQQISISSQMIETTDWQTYENSKYNFSFRYPSDWSLEERSQTEKTGGVISLRSPETTQLYNERKIRSYSYDLVISFWPNINSSYARGGSWIGQRAYTDLEDYYTDHQALKLKTGSIIIDGKNGYEVIIGGYGANYGVMFEYGGIYELSFETAWEKSQLTSTQKQILSTFKFLK